MAAQVYFFAIMMGASAQGAAILEWNFSNAPADWQKQGAAELFSWDAENGRLRAIWDSTKMNSFYSVALPRPLTIKDSFTCQFDLQLDSIEIGTTPGKPYTFQVAVGFLDSVASSRPEFFAGSGTDSVHGPKNLAEFNYFPDSGFGATVSPIMVSSDNHYFYSHNFPLELVPGNVYTVRMSFDAGSRTLQSTILENGAPYGVGGDSRLRSIVLPARFTDFTLDRFGISSYSDAGQIEQFAGSILAHGTVDNVTLTLPESPQPRLVLTMAEEVVRVSFTTMAGYRYQLESSEDLLNWTSASQPVPGNGSEVVVPLAKQPAHRFFRLQTQGN